MMYTNAASLADSKSNIVHGTQKVPSVSTLLALIVALLVCVWVGGWVGGSATPIPPQGYAHDQ